MNCGIIVTTHNRPHALARSLPAIAGLGAKVLVVDDGSDAEACIRNRAIAADCGIPILTLHENRGLCCALNIGLTYWLDDPAIDWISSFNDDVDVHPDLLVRMERVQDAVARPICTGYDAAEHAVVRRSSVCGEQVLFKVSTPGVHLHAHRDYWRGVMPIPTPYLGAPKRDKGLPGQGSDEDWWVTCWAPGSAMKRGLYVTCVTGMVNVFLRSREDSTWGGVTPSKH